MLIFLVNLTDPVFRGVYRGKVQHEGTYLFRLSQVSSKYQNALRQTTSMRSRDAAKMHVSNR